VRIGQHLLAYRLATDLGLDAVHHRLQFLGNLHREHLAHVVTFLVPVLKPYLPAGVVRSQLPVTCQGKFPPLALENHDGDGRPSGSMAATSVSSLASRRESCVAVTINSAPQSPTR